MIKFRFKSMPYQPDLTVSILLPRPLRHDPRFIQCIYRYSHASKRFVEVYMVKPNTLVYFVAQLHTCLHAEPDKTISHIIGLMILHHKMVTVNRFHQIH